MAIFNVTGLDEAIKQLDLAADALKERAPEAAVAGGKVAAAAFQRSAPVRTGQLAASMTVDGPHHTVADGYYCDVYPSGKRAMANGTQPSAMCWSTDGATCLHNRGCGQQWKKARMKSAAPLPKS